MNRISVSRKILLIAVLGLALGVEASPAAAYGRHHHGRGRYYGGYHGGYHDGFFLGFSGRYFTTSFSKVVYVQPQVVTVASAVPAVVTVPAVVEPVVVAPVVRSPRFARGTVESKTFTVHVPNGNGTFTKVEIERVGLNDFYGPQGEYYAEFPTVEQLQLMYAKK